MAATVEVDFGLDLPGRQLEPLRRSKFRVAEVKPASFLLTL
jgi:hypothetical protein